MKRPLQFPRNITHIVVCYWTTDDPTFGMNQIDRLYRACGYLGTPYHLCVTRTGHIQTGRTVDKAGPIDHPDCQTSVNIVVILPPDAKGTGETSVYTLAQRRTMERLLKQMKSVHPKAMVEANGPTRDSVHE